MAPVKKDFRPQNYGAVAQTLVWALHPGNRRLVTATSKRIKQGTFYKRDEERIRALKAHIVDEV